MTLKTLGWSDDRQQDFAPHTSDGLIPGRVISEHRTHFQVATNGAELTAEMTGRLRSGAAQRSDLPGVGDFVALRPSAGDGPATIETVLPRTTALVRKAAGEQRPQLLAANIDAVLIVTGLDGDFNLQRIERYLALVAQSGAAPVIVANKVDLAKDVEAAVDAIRLVAPGVPIHAISARARGCERELESYFDGNRTLALVGSSGAGKSTLTNLFLGGAVQATGDVRSHDDRGRHTTTHRQLFVRAQGGAIIDTPGMRGLELWQPEPVIESNFDDIERLAAQCKFRNCRHQTEPACAVRMAVARGDLDAGHLAKYSGHA
jgi:ribosome biogenesis GTPase / thiamine phosphate phosphatase